MNLILVLCFCCFGSVFFVQFGMFGLVDIWGLAAPLTPPPFLDNVQSLVVFFYGSPTQPYITQMYFVFRTIIRILSLSIFKNLFYSYSIIWKIKQIKMKQFFETPCMCLPIGYVILASFSTNQNWDMWSE